MPGHHGIAQVGWDYNRTTPHAPQRYVCELTGPADYASVLVAWHRHIAVTQDRLLVLNPSLANIDLKLSRLSDARGEEVVDVSRSSVDNVEHIYMTNLPAGRYAIEVSTDRPWNYAVTWDFYSPPRAGHTTDSTGEDRYDLLDAASAAIDPAATIQRCFPYRMIVAWRK